LTVRQHVWEKKHNEIMPREVYPEKRLILQTRVSDGKPQAESERRRSEGEIERSNNLIINKNDEQIFKFFDVGSIMFPLCGMQRIRVEGRRFRVAGDFVER
jgi:hypothetical protein